MAVERISLLGVPLDIVPPEELETQILEVLARPGTKQIIFLTVWDFLKARKKRGDFPSCVRDADLVLPISKSLLKACSKLGKNVPVRYNPFDFTIRLFSILDQYYKTTFFLGAHKKTLQTAERNVRSTFPNLQIVGRYVGYFKNNIEGNVITAIYKASPSLVLVSEGIKEKDCWSYRRRNQFSKSIFLYYHDALGIFSNRIKRVDEEVFRKGKEIRGEIARHPLKVFLIFPYIKFKLLVTWGKLFGEK